MPGRPKNPPTDRRQELLDAALRVFSAKGYAAATNADIAREAGVTAAALYHYFPSKSDLFMAVLTERKTTMEPIISEVSKQMAHLPPQLVLAMVVENFSRFMREERTQALMRIILAEAPRNPELAGLWQTQVVEPVATLLFGYIQGQVEQGRLQPMDPRLIFMLVAGPVFTLTIIKDVVRMPFVADVSTDELVRQSRELILPALLKKEAQP